MAADLSIGHAHLDVVAPAAQHTMVMAARLEKKRTAAALAHSTPGATVGTTRPRFEAAPRAPGRPAPDHSQH
jgi:hypothetical protein